MQIHRQFDRPDKAIGDPKRSLSSQCIQATKTSVGGLYEGPQGKSTSSTTVGYPFFDHAFVALVAAPIEDVAEEVSDYVRRQPDCDTSIKSSIDQRVEADDIESDDIALHG